MITPEDVRALVSREELKDMYAYWNPDEDQKNDHVGKTFEEMVKEFHVATGSDISKPRRLKRDAFRLDLIDEEVREVTKALSLESNEEVLKELADLIYVTVGTAVTFGWDITEAFRRVHENNMGRMTQPDGTIKKRPDGKIVKNPNYPKVDLSDLV